VNLLPDLMQMDVDLFAAMGEDAQVQRGTAAPVPVRVVFERGVKHEGEHGQYVQAVDMVLFRTPQWTPKPDDVLIQGAVRRKIDTIADDDGYVVKAVLYG